jgi:8-oxo-dGTP pyrophosphatase MutT (NUDIX family)
MEFIRGKYDLKNIDYIRQLFKDMTFDERQFIMNKTFNELWNHVWYQQYLLRHTTEYNFARSKFDALNAGFYVNDTFVDLNYIIANTESQHCEPEWGFPKGRRRIREEDSACAVREFCEETGCKANSIELSRSLTTFEEVFFGTNNVLYKHVYYVGKMTHDGLKTMNINKNNLNQVREVRAVEWFTYEEALDHIRNHNKERKQLFARVHQTICTIESSDAGEP